MSERTAIEELVEAAREFCETDFDDNDIDLALFYWRVIVPDWQEHLRKALAKYEAAHAPQQEELSTISPIDSKLIVSVCPTCGWPNDVFDYRLTEHRVHITKCPTCGLNRPTYAADEGTSGFMPYPGTGSVRE